MSVRPQEVMGRATGSVKSTGCRTVRNSHVERLAENLIAASIRHFPANKLKLKEIVAKQNAEESPVVKDYMKISSLPHKDGPCVQVTKDTLSKSDEAGAMSSTPT